jgi:hypothetical protein
MKTAKLVPGEGANIPWLYRGILSALAIAVRWLWLGALVAAARAASLSSAQRKKIAKAAAKARWARSNED